MKRGKKGKKGVKDNLISSKSKPEEKEDLKNNLSDKDSKEDKKSVLLEQYEFMSDKIPVVIKILKTMEDFVPIYTLSISSISKTTEIILEKIRKELIKEVNLGMVNIANYSREGLAEKRFIETIDNLIKRYFPDVDIETSKFLTSYLIQKSLGMGNIEILDDDPNLEEIVINNAIEPVWVYHRNHGWLKSDIYIE